MVSIPMTHRGPDDGGNYQVQWQNGFLDVSFVTDIGKKREHNEDSCLMCAPDSDELVANRGLVFAVADGMGGASAGELASHLALETMLEQFYKPEQGTIPARMIQSIEDANLHIFQHAEEHPEYYGMGTTLSALVIHGDNAYIGQVGDSRIYLQRSNEPLKQLTEDHSLVAEQVRNGIISEEEAQQHTLRNLITRAVGIKPVVEVDLFSLKIKKGDRLLICSDGLCGQIDNDEIEQKMVHDPPLENAQALLQAALDSGGADNITIAVVQVVDSLESLPLQSGGEEIETPPEGFFQKLKNLFG